MSEWEDPQRLLTKGDAFERELVAAGVQDGPRGRSVRRAAAAIGLGTATLGTAGVATGTTIPLTMAAPALTFVKWIGVAAIGAAVVGGAVHAARSRANSGDARAVAAPAAPVMPRETPASSPLVAPSPVVVRRPPGPSTLAPSTAAPSDPAPRATMGARPPIQDAPAQVRSPLQAVTRSPIPVAEPPAAEVAEEVRPASAATADDTRASPPGASPTAHAPLSASSLTAETRALDEARVALRASQPARASEALDAYDVAFPHGMLAQEAMILRIESTLRSGDSSGATRLARAFARKHPDSPLLPRVRSMIPALTNP